MAAAVSLFGRWEVQGSRVRALRELYHSFVREKSPEAKGRTLLREWLTPAQMRQFEEQGYFEVVGCAIRGGTEYNTGPLQTCKKSILKGNRDGSCASLWSVISSQATSCLVKRLPWRQMSLAHWR